MAREPTRLTALAINWLILLAILITIICVFVPFSPVMPQEGLDPSWRYGLNQAVAQGLVFGRDVIFTLGPYASIYTKVYYPATDHLMMSGSMFLALAYCVAISFVIRGSKWYIQLAFWAVMAALLYSRDALLMSYPLLVGLILLSPSNFANNNYSQSKSFVWVAVFLMSPFGMLPLVKGTLLILCAWTVGLVSLRFIVAREWRMVLVVSGVPMVCLPIFWMVPGQPIGALPQYFSSMLPIISGYSGAMGSSGSPIETVLYIFAVSALLCVLMLSKQLPVQNRLLFLLLYAGYLFLAFKAGFVRHDGHVVTSATALLLGVLVLVLAQRTWPISIIAVLSMAVGLFIDSHHIAMSPRQIFRTISYTYSSTLSGLKNRLTLNDWPKERFEEAIDKIKNNALIPRLAGSTDIYSFNQSQLIASGNDWNPRPVFQSYSAYTPSLIELNKEHLLGKKAPENVLFSVGPIDNRLPSLEDGASWSALLSSYSPTLFKRGFLYLKKRPSKKTTDERILGDGTYALGDIVPVDYHAPVVFVDVTIQPTFWGRLVKALYKPSSLWIVVHLKNGSTKRFRFIAGMGRSGFLISPLVENSAEFGLLYGGTEYLAGKEVASFSIVPGESFWQWKKSFSVTFKTIVPHQFANISKALGFRKFKKAERKYNVSRAEQCTGNVGDINGVRPAPRSFSASALLIVHGWLAKSAKNSILPDSVLLVLTDSKGRHWFTETWRTSREDVARYFNQPALNFSGYETTVDVSSLAGKYRLGLALSVGDRIEICPRISIPGFFKGAAK